jgi:hypothetical protein
MKLAGLVEVIALALIVLAVLARASRWERAIDLREARRAEQHAHRGRSEPQAS